MRKRKILIIGYLLFSIHGLVQLVHFSMASAGYYPFFQHIRSVLRIISYFEIGAIVYTLVVLYVVSKIISKYEISLKYSYSSIEKKSLAWLKKFLYIVGILWVMWSIPYLLEIIFGSFEQWHHYPLWLGMSAVIYWLGYTIYQKRELFHGFPDHQPVKIRAAETSPSARNYAERALQLLDTDKLYLQQDLTIATLSDKVGISPGYLSQILNQHGNTFYDLVNKKRVEHAKKLIADPRLDHYSLLAIAFDSGFNSKSTFNAAFRKYAGTTPSAYKESIKAGPLAVTSSAN